MAEATAGPFANQDGAACETLNRCIVNRAARSGAISFEVVTFFDVSTARPGLTLLRRVLY
jgi:hypothetical protein